MNGGIKLKLQDHGIIVGYAEDCSDETIINIAKKYGKLRKNKNGAIIQPVEYGGITGDIEFLDWHQDWAYGFGDYHGTLLMNLSGDENVEPTFFVSLRDVYKNLSDKFINELSNYEAFFSIPDKIADTSLSPKEFDFYSKYNAHRPIITHHPLTFEEIIYSSPATLKYLKDKNTGKIIDGSVKDCIIKTIKTVMDTYSFPITWKKNKYIIYDNFLMAHKRMKIGSKKRKLRRIQFSLTQKE